MSKEAQALAALSSVDALVDGMRQGLAACVHHVREMGAGLDERDIAVLDRPEPRAFTLYKRAVPSEARDAENDLRAQLLLLFEELANVEKSTKEAIGALMGGVP